MFAGDLKPGMLLRSTMVGGDEYLRLGIWCTVVDVAAGSIREGRLPVGTRRMWRKYVFLTEGRIVTCDLYDSVDLRYERIA